MAYDVNPGVSPIAAYSTTDTQCTSAPRFGPVDVEVAAGARTYLFAYGIGPDDLRLSAFPSGRALARGRSHATVELDVA